MTADIDAPFIATLLTPTECKALRAIVATNGGGVSTERMGKLEVRVVMRLHLMGLTQGMSGRPWRVVHTAGGLAVARAIKDAAP